MKCECEQHGFCPRYNQYVNKRKWECCQGTSGLPRWKEEYYLSKLVEPPSLAQKALNFGKAVVNHVISGGKTASNKERRIRLEICESCEFKVEDKCSACGCFLTAKAALTSESCPKGKWPDDKPPGDCGCSKA